MAATKKSTAAAKKVATKSNTKTTPKAKPKPKPKPKAQPKSTTTKTKAKTAAKPKAKPKPKTPRLTTEEVEKEHQKRRRSSSPIPSLPLPPLIGTKARHEYSYNEIEPVLRMKAPPANYSNFKLAQLCKLPVIIINWMVRTYGPRREELQINPHKRGKYSILLTEKERANLAAKIEDNPAISLTDLAKNGAGKNQISLQAVEEYMKEETVKVPLPKPISEDIVKARLEWAKTYGDWTVEQWRKVIWSSESSHHLGTWSVYVFVRQFPEPIRKKKKSSDDDFRLEEVPYVENQEYKYVGYWGAVTGDTGIGPIHIMAQGTTMKASVYHDILKEKLIPYTKELGEEWGDDGSGEPFQFYQTKTRAHNMKMITNYIEENNIEIVKFPTGSTDLYPMIDIWKLLKKRVDKRMSSVKTLEQLEKVVEEEWKNVDVESIRKIVDTMPERCQSVIRNKGGFI